VVAVVVVLLQHQWGNGLLGVELELESMRLDFFRQQRLARLKRSRLVLEEPQPLELLEELEGPLRSGL
jgi:hypothetical protein